MQRYEKNLTYASDPGEKASRLGNSGERKGLAEGVNPPPELDLATRGWTCCACSFAAKGHLNLPYLENQCSVA